MAHGEREYRLLIVDDDETDRRWYGWLLARQAPGQFKIEQAADGAAGITMLRTHTFDCVLLDFSLPDLTGLEFLATAVVNGALPTAFVLITGHGDEAIAVDAMKLGVQDYLVKDHVNEGRLWRAIVRAVSQRELRQNLTHSMRALTEVNASLEQEVAARKASEAELRAAKEAAELAYQAKTRFVAMMTQEFRTQLNAVLGYAGSPRDEGGLTEQQDARAAAMIRAGRHLLGVVERVRDFACIEAGHISLHPMTLSVRDLTEACIASVGPLADKHGLSLRLVCSHDAPRQIVADPARLRQVLLNLLDNALKFTAAGWVELCVLAGDTPNRLRIEVADTGPGIDPEASGRLFQDLECLDAPATVQGAGLGLAIVARFVDLMGGTISYRANPCGGSIFCLEMPRGEQVSADGGPLHAPPIAGRRVLLVDDIAMSRDVIGAFLRNAEVHVWLAESGQEGVRLASEQTFDVILMDVRMPEMDGLEAARRIRALPAPHGDVPILALAARLAPEQMVECEAAGMDGVVEKPVDHATLPRAIAGAIEGCPPRWDASGLPVDPGEQPVLRLDPAVLDRMLAFPPGRYSR